MADSFILFFNTYKIDTNRITIPKINSNNPPVLLIKSPIFKLSRLSKKLNAVSAWSLSKCLKVPGKITNKLISKDDITIKKDNISVLNRLLIIKYNAINKDVIPINI